MAGNKAGGDKARETNKKKYGENFYRIIGAKGGQISRGGGFASSRELAMEAGSKGGKASRRTGVANKVKRPKPAEWTESFNTLKKEADSYTEVTRSHEHKTWFERVFGKKSKD